MRLSSTSAQSIGEKFIIDTKAPAARYYETRLCVSFVFVSVLSKAIAAD
jgi:hypothetical protein